MAFPRLLSLPPRVIGLGFIVAYLALDWVSFTPTYGPIGLTPWDPGSGLGIVLILLFGPRHLPLLFAAPVLSGLLVRGMPAGWLVGLLSALCIGAGAALASLALLRPAPRFDVSLSSTRDLFLLLLIASVSAAGVSVAYVAIHAAIGLLPWTDFGAAALRFWISDLIGIAVVTPFALVLFTRGKPIAVGWEPLLQLALILVCLAIVFGTAPGRQMQLFYLLFLPIVWIAVRFGLEGVSAGLVVIQLGLVLALRFAGSGGVDVTTFQAIMLVLTMTGLVAGILVTERRRAELQLRLQQDAQTRLTRIGSMGELASALAHEINQPLMAAGTYTRLVAEAIASGGPPEHIGDAANKAAAQVERAAEVVRRLRDLIRLGRSELAPVSVHRIVEQTIELLQSDIDRSGVRIERKLPGTLPPVMADALQIQQVLLNLIRNSIEAIRETGRSRGVVSIEARQKGRGLLEICVRDDGPGFAVAAATVPLTSTKPDGLGIGLALSRSIIQAHGGSLEHGNLEQGAIVRFSLPTAETVT